MQKFLEIIPIVAANHLVLGLLIALVALAITRIYPFNAATRHDVWLGALLVVVFMPSLVLFPKAPIVTASSPVRELSTQVIPSSLVSAASMIIPDVSDTTKELNAETVPQHPDGEAILPLIDAEPESNEFAGTANAVFPLQILSPLLAVFILFGINLNMLRFIQAYLNVKRLFVESTYVDDSTMTLCCVLAQKLELNRIPVVKHSQSISSPLTGGILRPTILIPAKIYEANRNWPDSAARIEQVLLHELAHIKRRDPLIALSQSLISVFLFWHPVVHYINHQIRFERELASDDWVVSFTDSGDTSRLPDSYKAKDYASNLITIAESMGRVTSVSQTVGWLSSSRGLASRVENLLDRKIDHSIVSNRTVNVLVLTFVSIVLFVSSPLWPTIRASYAVSPAGQIEADTPVGAMEEFLAIAPTEGMMHVSLSGKAGALTEADLLGNMQSTEIERPDPINFQIPEVTISTRKINSFPNFSNLNRISDSPGEFGGLELAGQSAELVSYRISQLPSQLEGNEKQEDIESLQFVSASSSSAAEQQEAITHSANIRPIEEIVVVAPETLIAVYLRLQGAEADLYELFNAQNSDDRFDIVCEIRSTDHFLFKEQQFCEPAFLDSYRQLNLADVREARQNASNVVASFFSALTGPKRMSDKTLRRTAAEEMQQVQQEIINFASTNTEFAAQLYAVSQLQTELDNKIGEAEDRFGDVPRGGSWGYNAKAAQTPGTREYRASPPI